MAYLLQASEAPPIGLRRVAAEEYTAAAGRLEEGPPHVHGARKGFKRLRALWRLLRPHAGAAYERENRRLRDWARELAGARDAETLIEALDALEAVDAPDLRTKLLARRDGFRAPDLARRAVEIAGELRALGIQAAGWPLPEAATLEPGLRATYRRARGACRRAVERTTTEALHEWRKQVKYHWHHMQLLDHPRKADLKKLARLLGDDHDLALLRTELAGEHHPALDARRTELQQAALRLGEILFRAKPKEFIANLNQS